MPHLQLSTDQTAICAGGWDATRGAYQYLQKETGQWITRGAKPDPHIATLTAQVTDGYGQPLAGQTVTFQWDMPGPAPAATRTVTTDANGIASVEVISGDELSEDFDPDTGELLFNNPVAVQASYGNAQATQYLDVLAPDIQWQYKDESGQYVAWYGEVWGLYSPANDTGGVPLRAVLTFNNAPVIGHPVSWGIDTIYDKGGAEVLPGNEDYSTYGYMSGPISTTTSDGSATATFTHGYNAGQLVFAIYDAAVFTPDSSAATNSVSTNSVAPPMAAAAGQAASPAIGVQAASSGRRIPNTSRYKTISVGEYRWVQGKGSFNKPKAYPAPSGEEDNELLPQTRNFVRFYLPGSESKTGSRYQTGLFDNNPAAYVPGISQMGNWWFSQVVGNDQESDGRHLADLTVTTIGLDSKGRLKPTTRYYGAAFDIVLTGVQIFEQVPGVQQNVEVGRRAEFGPYVKSLRYSGIVAWHRWAGESPSTSENEIHCVDPATPFLKNSLQFQIREFRRLDGKGTGSQTGSYPADPTNANDPAYYYFHIYPGQKDKVKERFKNKLSVPGAVQDNITP